MVNAALIILCVMALCCATLGIGMAVAWHGLGRERHALSWAFAYGVAAMQWGLNALGVLLQSRQAIAISRAFLIVSLVMLALGAWQRAGRTPSPRLVAWMTGAGALLAYLMVLWGMAVPRGIAINGMCALVLGSALWASWPRGRATTGAERIFVGMLGLLTFVDLSFAFASLGIGRAASEHRYFAAMLMLLPPVYMGVGIAAIVLVAGDMATVLRRLVTHDPLTGILNRRGMEEATRRAIAYAHRHGQTLAAVICDLDNFKALNDAGGHVAGDAALRYFAEAIRERVRTGDLVARIGGDEFALILLNSNCGEAADVVERVREELAGGFSASFGVTDLRAGDRSLEDLVIRADRALYHAKQQGRDRVTRWEEAA